MSAFLSDRVRAQASRCVEQADVLVTGPAAAQLREDFGAFCISEVRRILRRPGASTELRPYVAQALKDAGNFLCASFAAVSDGAAREKFTARLNAIVPFTFEAEADSPSAIGASLFRMVGLSRDPTSMGDELKLGANAVHELAHAAALVKIGSAPPNARPDDPSIIGSARVVSQGWSLARSPKVTTGPDSLFSVLEELASSSHDGAWYGSRGAVETALGETIQVNLRPEVPAHAKLIAAISIIAPQSLSYRQDQGQGTEPTGSMQFTTTIESKVWQFEGKRYESAYAVMKAAFDQIAPEIFPHMAKEAAISEFHRTLREVQAFGGHRRLLLPMRRAFGEAGFRFIAELEPPAKIDANGINNILASLFAGACFLPDELRSMARGLLREAQIEVQKLKAR